ncbi:MAG: transketolase [Bacteroidales bacterium]
MNSIKKLEQIASQVRRDIVRMTHAQSSGHPGGSLGCTEYLVSLYFSVLKHNPENFTIEEKEEDLFFLSNGHISPAWYSVLARSGYFDINELKTFRQINSRLQGHPATEEKLPGVRVASGSLGQGLSVAAGAALAKRINQNDAIVYSLHGDGEMQEGQNWEAAMFCAGHKIDNLIATIDYNGKQIDGPVDEIMPLGNLKAKFESFGWDVMVCEKGNDMESVLNILNEAKKHTGKSKPVMILLKTEMGYGVDFMTGTHAWHGKAPNDEELEKALAQLEETTGDY